MTILLRVHEVAALFRTYMDEHDESFLSDDNVSTYLRMGENEYRQFVTDMDPSVFATRLAIPFSTIAPARFYDLDSDSPTAGPVTVLGSLRTNALMTRLVNVYLTEAGDINHVTHVFRQVHSTVELRRAWDAYYLDGGKIRFSGERDDDFVIEYIPLSSVFWEDLAPASSIWIDNLGEFHDLIALFGYSQYAIRDVAANPLVIRQLEKRKKDLAEFIRHRGQSEPTFVNDVYGGLWEPDDSGW